MNPTIENVGPLGLDQPAVGAEYVGELEGPEVDELGALQEPVDHRFSLVLGFVGLKGVDLVERG